MYDLYAVIVHRVNLIIYYERVIVLITDIILPMQNQSKFGINSMIRL